MTTKDKADPPAMQAAAEFKPALRPRKRLFVALCVIFGLWVIFLIALYFKTVYPMRHH